MEIGGTHHFLVTTGYPQAVDSECPPHDPNDRDRLTS